MKHFFPVSLLLCCITAFGQKQDTVKKYLDSHFKLTTKSNMVYPAMAVRDNDHWILMANYPNDSNLLFRIYFKDKSLTVHDGPHIIYYRANIKSEEMVFKNDIADGVYQYWYENGNPKDSGNLANGQKMGLWKTWYPTGKTESIGTYMFSKAEGEWNWYYENGKPCTKEQYVKGKITKLECFTENGEYSGDRCGIAKMPMPIGITGSLDTYLEDSSKLNNEMKSILADGPLTVKVKFTITKAGNLTNVIIVDTPTPSFGTEAARLLQLIRQWSPYISHNRPQDYIMEYDVPFSLHE